MLDKPVCHRYSGGKKATRGDQGQVIAITELDRFADLEVDLRLMGHRLAGSPQPKVAGAGPVHHRPCGRRGLHRVSRGDHRHVWQGTHDGDILRCVVGHAQGPVGESAADGHDLHVGLVVADVIADLLQAPQRGEVGDGVGEHHAAGQGHACCHAGHVLLGYSCVYES